MDNGIVISLCNGEKILLTIDENNTRGKRLGYFYPSKNEIDFEPREEWVKTLVDTGREKQTGIVKGFDVKFFRNYKYDLPQPVDFTFTTAKESFISLLQSEAAKKWKYKENPHGNEPERYVPFKHAGYYTERENAIIKKFNSDKKQWTEAQQQVLPSKLLVIKIEK